MLASFNIYYTNAKKMIACKKVDLLKQDMKLYHFIFVLSPYSAVCLIKTRDVSYEVITLMNSLNEWSKCTMILGIKLVLREALDIEWWI